MMRNGAILGGAALIAISIYASSFTNHFEIADDAQGGNVVWRIDNRTGLVDACYFAKSENPFEGDNDYKEIKCANYVGKKLEIAPQK